MTTAIDSTQRPDQIDRGRFVLLLVAQPFLLAVLLFLPAGTLGWSRGWLFLLVYVMTGALVTPYIWRVNPAFWRPEAAFAGRKRGIRSSVS